VAGADEFDDRGERAWLGSVDGEVEQRSGKWRAEQLRRVPGRLDELPGSLPLATVKRSATRGIPVEPVEPAGKVSHDVAPAGNELPAALLPLSMSACPLLRSPLGGLPATLLGLVALGHDCRQIGQLAAPEPVWTSDAVVAVELDRQVERLVPRYVGGGCMLAANFEPAHRHAGHAARHAIAIGHLHPGMPAVTTHQFDRIGVVPAALHGLCELVFPHFYLR
jgi:hypothetical protein